MARKRPLITDFANIPEAALVPEEEQPYEIPAHWKWVRFESIVDALPSPQVRVKKSDYLAEGKYPIVDQGSEFIAGYCNSAAGLIDHSKELVIFGDHTREVKLIDFPFIQGADGIKILESANTLLPRFLFYWLGTEPVESRGYRRHFPLLKQLSFPLPPLEVQQRIVDYLEKTNAKVDDVIQRLEQYVEEVPARRNELIQAGISGAMTLDWRKARGLAEESWLHTTIGDLGIVVTGNTPSTKNPENYGQNLPFIKPTDLNQGRHTISADSHLSEIGAKIARVTPAGSVAMCCIGATITKAGLIEVEAATNQQINVLTPSTDHDAVFLFYLFESPQFKSEVIASSSSTTLPIINKGRFSKLEVTVPSLPEQQEIARLLDGTLSQLEQTNGLVQEAIAKLHSLRSHNELAALAGGVRGTANF